MSDPNYEIPEWPTQRLRYFDNLFLQSQDFVDEQSFHLAVRQRDNRLLRVSGVVDGLGVSAHPAEAWSVVVAPGSAVDELGRTVLLAGERTLDLRRSSGTQFVYLSYREKPTGASSLTAANEGVKGENRWSQEPLVEARPDESNPPAAAILLASVVVRANGGVDRDGIVDERRASGLRLPIPGAGGATCGLLATRDKSLVAAAPDGVQLGYLPANGSEPTAVLKVTSAGVRVEGPLTAAGLAAASLKVSERLEVRGSAKVDGQLAATSLQVQGELTVGGALTVEGVRGGLVPARALVIWTDNVNGEPQNVPRGWQAVGKAGNNWNYIIRV